MSAHLSPLSPGVRVETHTYANGKTETIYIAPFESDGPRLVQEHCQRVLCYMYAAYVFRWPEGTSRLDIGHGSIDAYMELRQNVTITGRWHPNTLAVFGQQWAQAEFRKFER